MTKRTMFIAINVGQRRDLMGQFPLMHAATGHRTEDERFGLRTTLANPYNTAAISTWTPKR